MCHAVSQRLGAGEVEAGDPGVGRRPDNFFRTLQLTYNTYKHKRDAQDTRQSRSNSWELAGS